VAVWRCRNGCATSEDILWKLEALQTFVADLHWPDEVFAEHISQRLQSMSNEMVEAAANRCAYILSPHHKAEPLQDGDVLLSVCFLRLFVHLSVA